MNKYHILIAWWGCLLSLLLACTNDSGDDKTGCGRDIIIDRNQYQSVDNESAIFIDTMYIDDHCLIMRLGYSGCNGGHDMDVITGGDVAESLPVQVHFKLRDNDPQLCEAYFTEEYRFNLRPLEELLVTEPSARLIFPDQGKEVLWEQ